MAYVLTDESNYEDIADAIREKTESSATYKPSEMAEAIRGIQTGGDVTGVKGNAESSYRTGDVNITPGNVGAKALQTAVVSPSASGTAIEFIDSISQDAQGVITPTKKTVRGANSSQSGLMSAADKVALDNAVTNITALQTALAAAEAQRLAMYPTDTAGGASVAILDGADNVPLKAMQLRITSQSGVTGVTVTRRGKNIAELEDATYAYAGGLTIKVRDGVVTIEGAYGSTGAINRVIGTAQLRAGVTYTISGTKSSGITDANVLRIDLRNPGGSVIASGDSYNGFTYTPSEDVTAQVNIRIESQQTFNVAIYPQVEAGSVATDFVPNTPTTYEIDWTETAGSAHDVTLDALTGALTADGDAYTVTPVDVRTLLGVNTFSVDAGTLSVTWRADIAAYVARKIAEALNA